jgi:acetyl esterase/lipase
MFPPTELRTTRFAGVVFGLSLCFCIYAEDGALAYETPIAPDVVLEDRYPQRLMTFANGVTGFADVVYSELPGFRPLTLDLYLPAGALQAQSAYPLLVYIHGGGWQSGHTRHLGAFENWPATLASIAADGYVVASVEYRLSGEAPFPAAFRDVRNAIRWLRDNAEKFSIDGARVVVWGASAGGQLAALVGTACGDNRFNPAAEQNGGGRDAAKDRPACIQGVVAWYSVLNLADMIPAGATALDTGAVAPVLARYLGCAARPCDAEAFASASPITHIDSKDPPFLLIHGSDDSVVPVTQSQQMNVALTEAGVESELVVIPNVKHSFVGKTSVETAAASRLAFRKTMAFVARSLSVEPAVGRPSR